MAASFLSRLGDPQDPMSRFITPPGLDLSSVAEHGNAVLLAWAGDYSPVKTLRQFSPPAEPPQHAVAGSGPIQSLKSKV